MRLAMGLCGHFAKAACSSPPNKKLEVIEVRKLVSVSHHCSFGLLGEGSCCVSITPGNKPPSVSY